MAELLLVDDDEAFSHATEELLTLLGHSIDLSESVSDACEKLKNKKYDRIFLDIMLPDGSGFHVLEHIPVENKDTKVTIITGHPSIKSHVMSVYGMNVNYLIKPIELEQLKRLFSNEENSRGPKIKKYFNELIGETKLMHELYETINSVANSTVNVMLFGESGVGKEVVAQAIHSASGRSGAMVAINCGAFSNELIGSELFGHEKGAFTGAISKKTGVFEQANNGTLFLDEITEMPLALQPNLLRVLESQMVTRIGATSTLPVNCRVISATNRNEEEMVNENCLREDLYYRLAVFPIHIPPLRDRLDDVPLLVTHFIAILNRENNTAFKIQKEDLNRLSAYDWPGNIRELRHIIYRAYIMTKPEDNFLNIPKSFSSPFSNKINYDTASILNSLVGNTIEDIEKTLIKDTLLKYDNNKTKAAEILGVSVKTLYNRLNSYKDNEN